MQLRAVMQVDDGYQVRRLNLEEFHDPEQDAIMQWELSKLMEGRKGAKGISEVIAWDDLTGMELDGNKVKEARAKEIDYVRNKPVWVRIPRRQAQARG